jgi:hypothetical protein
LYDASTPKLPEHRKLSFVMNRIVTIYLCPR